MNDYFNQIKFNFRNCQKHYLIHDYKLLNILKKTELKRLHDSRLGGSYRILQSHLGIAYLW